MRRSEKHKNFRLILPIVGKLVYEYTKHKQGSGLKKWNLGHFLMRKWPTKWLWPLCKWTKCLDYYRGHGIEIGFEKYDITKKGSKIGLPNQTTKISKWILVDFGYQSNAQSPTDWNTNRSSHFQVSRCIGSIEVWDIYCSTSKNMCQINRKRIKGERSYWWKFL